MTLESSLCHSCIKAKKRKFQSGVVYTPKKLWRSSKFQENPSCFIPDCEDEGRIFAKIDVSLLKEKCGVEVDQKFDQTQQNLCDKHRNQYGRDISQCIVCGCVLRGVPSNKKRVAKPNEKQKIKQA